MFKFDAQEAAPICNRVLTYLLTLAPTSGRSGSDLRTAVGDFLADAFMIIQSDKAGPPLAEIYDLARLAGVTQAQLSEVRATATLETPKTVGGQVIKNALIGLAIATEGVIIADMNFVSREDVEVLKKSMNVAFNDMEEIAADDMAQATYQALIGLHGAILYHLAITALPLPRMLDYQFNTPLPTLVIAYKLYSDAGRADEVRAENKIIHPAFSPMLGRGLSN